MDRMRRPARQGGFSLLEAIVALTIFSMGAIALYGWLASSLRMIERVRQQQERAVAVQSALEIARTVNPLLAPSGRREIGELAVAWSSRPLEPVRPVVNRTGLPTIFEAGLYVMDVRVLRGDGELARFELRQVGQRQTGTLEEE